MSVTTEFSHDGGIATDRRIHENCIVCGPSNDRGLRLQFTVLEDGSVEACFNCDKTFAGYPGVLHGGVISALLDGAMTNCIFAHGFVAVTAELKVRYRHPMATDRVAMVRGWVRRVSRPLYLMGAELRQDGLVRATATAKFMDQPQLVAERRTSDESTGTRDGADGEYRPSQTLAGRAWSGLLG